VFESFFTTKANGQGPRLGPSLSQVWGLLDQAGGRSEVASRPGQGASFRPFLPSYEAEASP
jgi:two-component system, cell cycle sensor histidine kinase and response regulator CckA